MTFIPRPQEIYRHFKGNLYQVVTLAEDSETGKQLVIYQALYGEFKTYARELGMFTGRVDREKYPQVTQEFRFELQGPGSERQRAESAAAGKADVRDAGMGNAGVGNAGMGNAGMGNAGIGNAAAGKAVAGIAVEGNASGEAPAVQAVNSASASNQADESGLDPLLLEFLDADSYETKLNVLAALHHRITQDMITTMAVASDVEVGEGELEDRYVQLKKCLLTMEKYECNRMR